MKGRGEGQQSTLFLSMETRTDKTRQGDLHFESFPCIYFESSFVPHDVELPSHWMLGLLWFWFYDNQLKSPVKIISYFKHDWVTLEGKGLVDGGPW